MKAEYISLVFHCKQQITTYETLSCWFMKTLSQISLNFILPGGV